MTQYISKIQNTALADTKARNDIQRLDEQFISIENSIIVSTFLQLKNAINNILLNKSNFNKIILKNDIQATETLFLGTNVNIDLNGFTIKGNDTLTLFKTGFVVDGVIKEYNDPTYTTSIENCIVENGYFENFNIVFNIIKHNRNCKLENIFAKNVIQLIKGVRCYYCSYEKIYYRPSDWVKEIYEEPIIYLSTENNANKFDTISIYGRKKAIQIYDITSAFEMNNITIENCDIGVEELGNEIRNMKIKNSYFENCNTALNLTVNCELDNNFFNSCNIAIKTPNAINLKENNVFKNCTKSIDNISLGGSTIKNKTNILFENSVTHENYNMLDSVINNDILVNSVDNTKSIINKSNKDSINQLRYFGISGYIPNSIPFCSHYKTTLGEPVNNIFNITIDTNISYEKYNFVGFNINITDNDNTHSLYGTIYGDKVVYDCPTSKEVVVLNRDGYLSIRISQFTHPTGFYAIEGVIRLL